jgi:precorrin-2/cobalt-factor-2 C20-methyltransferase
MIIMSGKLYGVGVGTGASDLMTLRAVNCLKAVDCIAIPRRDRFSPSVAWTVAEPVVGQVNDQERIFLNFPMTKDPTRLRPAWDIAFAEIGRRLGDGKNVAFITEGDPFVYSTFIYLYNHAKAEWPDVTVEVIPGVTSISSVPITAGIPLADGQEKVAIIPASYGIEELRTILRMFDTIILMKVSCVMKDIVAALEAEGLLEHSVYVAKATMKGEQIIWDLKSIKEGNCVYFSMVMVKKAAKSGLLEGKTQKEKQRCLT